MRSTTACRCSTPRSRSSRSRLFYRGRDVARLIEDASLEGVAAWLWRGDDAPVDVPAPDAQALAAARASGLPPVEAMQLALPLAGAADPQGWDADPTAIAAAGARILSLFVALAGATEERGPITPAASPAAGVARAAPLLSAALVACADHELNVSTFTARCVASAGSSVYHAVNAGLCALQGTRHGGHTRASRRCSPRSRATARPPTSCRRACVAASPCPASATASTLRATRAPALCWRACAPTA
ncbi:MAG: citrate/2-methylcitrate synthase [Burkholderiaceae bacterium]